MTAAPTEARPAASFDDVYTTTRGQLFQALATITDDRDLATEAIDIGFTRWRRRLRKPSGVSPAAGVMGHAFKFVTKQGAKASSLSGFRLETAQPVGADAYVERFEQLSVDERAILVMKDVLGWSETDIGHAVGAHGVAPAIRSLADRLEVDGIDGGGMATALRARAAGFTEPLSRLDSVKTKGSLQRIAMLAGGIAVVALAVVGVLAILDRDATAEPPVVGGDPTTPAVAGAALSADNAFWQRVPTPINGENFMTVAHDGENFFMFGMDQRGRPTMVTSDNGLDWAQVPAPNVGQNTFFSHVAAKEDRLVLIGSGFDEVRGNETAVIFTTEDRELWEEVQLPVADQVDVGGQTFDVFTWVSGVSVADDGFTVIGNQHAEVDPERLLGDVVDPALLRNGWGFTVDGMEFYNSNGGVAESRTWDELGLDPQVANLLDGRPVLWKSADGVEWSAVETDTPPRARGVQYYVASDGFEAALAWGDFGQTVWIRSDAEWERPDIDGSLTAMTLWNNKLIVSGFDAATGESSIWSSADGLSWERTPVGAGSIHQFFTSDSGIVGFGFVDEAAALIGPVEIEADGFTVTASSDGRYVVRDAAGETIVEVFEEDVIRGDMVSIVDPETGETVVQFSEAELEDAWERLFRQIEPVGAGPPQMALVLSTDGDNWTTLRHQEAGFFAQSVAFGNNSLLLLGWNEGGEILGFGGGGQEMWLVTPES